MSAALRIFAFFVIIGAGIGLGLGKCDEQRHKISIAHEAAMDAAIKRARLENAYLHGANAGMELAGKISTGYYTNTEQVCGELNRRCAAFVDEEAK